MLLIWCSFLKGCVFIKYLNIGLESVGVKLAKDGAIEVDEYSQTSVSSIWAVGDVTNRINLTPVALMEGEALVKTLFQDNPKNLIIELFLLLYFLNHQLDKLVLLRNRPYNNMEILTSSLQILGR
ncbi:hypothetical protein GLYMA_02G142001v4 [Glycine max]|nr:hypothetical protein GLYMA_02G142001v4 [Glycine max]KAH1060288.1 hypothetical protein GYH30_003989 [Glycine max]